MICEDGPVPRLPFTVFVAKGINDDACYRLHLLLFRDPARLIPLDRDLGDFYEDGCGRNLAR